MKITAYKQKLKTGMFLLYLWNQKKKQQPRTRLIDGEVFESEKN